MWDYMKYVCFPSVCGVAIISFFVWLGYTAANGENREAENKEIKVLKDSIRELRIELLERAVYE